MNAHNTLRGNMLNTEDFSLTIDYNKALDKLDIEATRNLNNGDILLLLVNILSMVEPEYRPAVLDVVNDILNEAKDGKLN